MPWRVDLVKKVERYLMAVPRPCLHALNALESLLWTKEMRGGVRLDSVLLDLLKNFEGKIDISFIYGSTAKLAQKSDSDIDLLVVGEVRLKDLSLALSEAEQVVGRPINLVIYTKEKFLEKRNERDPFLMQVLKGEKIVLGGSDHELRALASKPVHHQAGRNGARAASALENR
jgi:predicted nucleotidyltransferase